MARVAGPDLTSEPAAGVFRARIAKLRREIADAVLAVSEPVATWATRFTDRHRITATSLRICIIAGKM